MKDFLGQELAVGDTVVVPRVGYVDLVKVTIRKITAKRLAVDATAQYRDPGELRYVDPLNVVKVPN
ncbi:hypothetical protein [Pseudoduganella lutea]|uniref:Uncharacterized protein n=1 Tax=Pseudoduganella lutea TaxID=321985 RepID=A0A4P6L5W0_9BURK|nr:hypothetical protein [Pseudoduganella lutea]QBE66854.1 hypothetical protein EWM63_31000 [Pseudoduganella lutea]